MNIIISNSSGRPIYEQITSQLKQLILTGELKPHDCLPSMRLLAKELRISVITTKRAYEELEQAGYLVSVAGKGSFAAHPGVGEVRREQEEKLESHLKAAATIAREAEIPWEELEERLERWYKQE